ncbi:response regulator [Sphingomonas sp. LY160]|uniref:response regulator n=1 Tax=Sphingomonas sp. LY160 TaxID=3095342 RepID=UPI002ADEF458|nr:response regulator [Sphingomonas sp. LY160]MEA1070928.1 response regulator [Sphingomonas sp. LY160]
MTKVLYVDDDDDIREIAVMSLQLDQSFDVQSCSSGAEAVAVASRWQPDLILLDVMMPQMDGPSTLRALRSGNTPCPAPVVFVTARTHSAEVSELIALGALGVIPKPFDPMTLAEKAKSFVIAG